MIFSLNHFNKNLKKHNLIISKYSTIMPGYIPNGSQICSEGIVKTLFMENTFTILDSFIELYQNSDDANSTKVYVNIIEFNGKKWLHIKDNGDGMTMEIIDQSLNLLSRKEVKKTHGKFNFGGKASMLFLSGINTFIQFENKSYNGDCILLTKYKDNNPVCYSMNGSELINKGWDGTIKPTEINSGKESVLCNKFNTEFPIENGTSIFIELTNYMEKDLIEQEQVIKKELQLHCNERLKHCELWICLSGTDNGHILYESILNKNIIPEKKITFKLNVYLLNQNYIFTFEYDGKILGIKPCGKERWKKNFEEFDEEEIMNYGEMVGYFNFSMACNYEYKKDISHDSKNDDNNIYVERNGFCLNSYLNEILNTKSRSGDNHGKITARNIKSVLSYISNDKLDSIIGINMHKSDIKWNKLPKQFQRTIKRISELVYNNIKSYIDINEYKPQNKPLINHVSTDSDSNPDSDSDSDSDPDSDSDSDSDQSIEEPPTPGTSTPGTSTPGTSTPGTSTPGTPIIRTPPTHDEKLHIRLKMEEGLQLLHNKHYDIFIETLNKLLTNEDKKKIK